MLSRVQFGWQSLMYQVYGPQHPIHGAPAAPSNENIQANISKTIWKLVLSRVEFGGQSFMYQVYGPQLPIHGAPAAPSSENRSKYK